VVGRRPGGRNLELAWAAGCEGKARVAAGPGSNLVVPAGAGAGVEASWGIGMAATMARHVDMAIRLGGRYLNESMLGLD